MLSFFLEHLNLNPLKYKCKLTELKCLTKQKEGQTSVGLLACSDKVFFLTISNLISLNLK
jgi:hypothetical protein